MRSFVKEYFDGKPVDKLKTTITPSWHRKTTLSHLAMIDVPENAMFVGSW